MEEAKISPVRKRPRGMTLIALLLGIEGVLAIVAALVSLSIVMRIPLAIVGLIISVLIALVCLVLAWGLWTLKPWAFGATVAVQILNIVSTVFNFVAMLPKNTLSSTLGNIIIPVLILVYLFANHNARSALRG